MVRVLESPKNQEMKLAQQVRDMLTASSLPRAGDEDVQITTHRPSMTRCSLYKFSSLVALPVAVFRQPVEQPVRQTEGTRSLSLSPPAIPPCHPPPIRPPIPQPSPLQCTSAPSYLLGTKVYQTVGRRSM